MKRRMKQNKVVENSFKNEKIEYQSIISNGTMVSGINIVGKDMGLLIGRKENAECIAVSCRVDG